MVNTIKFSEFSDANLNDSTTDIVGLASGINIKTPKVVVWTTATRPVPPFDGLLGFNTDLEQYEYWSASLSAWVQLASSENLNATFILKTPDLTLPNSFALSTLSTGILKSTTGTGVPSISAPLTSIDNLVTSANQMLYTTGSDTYATTSLSTFSRSLLADINAITWRTDLGVPGIPVNVSEGGTGNTSFTAFSVILAGTTSTNPFQNVSGLGLSGQVLTSNGAGFAPTWQAVSASGTVNPGLINEVAYYAASGTTLSGLPTASNGVLITDNSGVPSISSTLPIAVQGNITAVGTITSGVWNGTVVTVPFGGTGDASFTAYSVICGGTTSTGNLQNVSGVGLVGQVLTSNGAGFLPTWQNAAGTGTVNSGSINQLAYYAANGNTVSGLATANDGLLVTNNSGVPSILAGPGTTGNILQSNSAAAPSFSTATYPSIATGTGTILRADGTNWVASTATYPNTTTANQLLYSSSNNVIAGLTSANNGTLVTSAAGVPSILAGPGTTGNILQSNAAAAPSFSTATYPSTTTINRILYSSAANVVSEITTANSAWLTTNASGVPSFNTTLPFNQVTVQVFTSSGTYTPTTGMKYCQIECVGGGGAGGSTGNTTGTVTCSGGGGGSGGYSKKVSTAATIGASQTVTIGTAGAAGAAGNNPGGAGGDTSVGTICIAKGGSGGSGTSGATQSLGGNGGTAGTGDLIAIGNAGGAGGLFVTASAFYPSSQGANSIYGGGAQPLNTSGTGNVAPTGSFGAGGGGGTSINASGTAAGGNGAKGIVIITEYLSV